MKKNIILLALISFVLIALNDFTKAILELNLLLYNSLSEKFTSAQILEIFEMQDKWLWLSYIFIPIFLTFKTIIITSIIYTGIFMFSKTQVSFKQLWHEVLKSESIFFIVPILKIIWFYFFETNHKLEDIQSFYPFSGINITGYKNLEQWLIYPLQTLNLFEFAYIIYLGYQVGKLTNTTHDNGLKIIAYSYIPMLILWLTVVMFFTLNYT